jgi:hypothetical protein
MERPSRQDTQCDQQWHPEYTTFPVQTLVVMIGP